MEFSTRTNGRRLLLLLAVVIGVAAFVQDLHFDNTQAAGRAVLVGRVNEISALETSLAELRSAQVGYLVPDQDLGQGFDRASGIAARMQAGLAQLSASDLGPATRARIDAAEAALEALTATDERARQALAGDDRTLAASTVGVEGAAAAGRLTTELGAAKTSALDESDRAMRADAQLRLGLTGGALGSILLLAVLAVRLSKQPAPSEAATMAQMLRELPPPVRATPASATPATPGTAAAQAATTAVPTTAGRTPATPPVPAPAPVTAAAPAAQASATGSVAAAVPAQIINLPATAELCGDLARVIDSRDVSALLARVAKVLDARGVIIWTTTADGSVLQPTLTHGYSDKVLSRLGPLNVDADNVTSLAYRSRRSQQVGGSGTGSAGAIAVPLVTASGCTGVLAAEVRDTRMAPDSMAVARIIAAQFATLIAPADEALAVQAAEA